MRSLAFLVAVCLAAGCAAGDERVLSNAERPAAMVQSPLAGYRLGMNDVVRVEVFGEPTLSHSNATTEGVRLNEEGKVGLPLLGLVELHGLTVKQAEQIIEQRLADGYLKHPRVTVNIVRYRNYFISGEVKNPGGYPYEGGLTVIKAAALAGGFTDKSATGRIKIKRRKGLEEETIQVELEDAILPDDVIIVPQSFF